MRQGPTVCLLQVRASIEMTGVSVSCEDHVNVSGEKLLLLNHCVFENRIWSIAKW